MSQTDKSYPSLGSSSFALTVLFLAYVLSFIDRNILTMLVEPIRAEFEISDFMFSVLHGWAFTLFYVFLGIPLGWLADRYSRKWIITTGVFFWSLMTCLCGIARQFGTLFITRIGVGVGEAALSPSAYSMLADYFSADRLRWATAIFALGITVGTGTSYWVGGALIDYFTARGGLDLPIGAFKPWQATFLAVGLPGFVVVVLLLFVREPKRQLAKTDSAEAPSLPEVIAFVRQHWRVYGSLMMGVSMMSVIGYGTLTWFPSFLVRTYGVERAVAGEALGSMFLIWGSLGTLMGAAFSTALQRLGYTDANMRMVLLAALICLVPAIAAPLMPSYELAILVATPVIFFHYTHFGVSVAALTVVTPNRMRAQVSALLLFLTNLFGLALGGSFVAFFTDFVFQADDALRYSLVAVAAIVYPLAAILIGLGLKHYRQRLAEVS